MHYHAADRALANATGTLADARIASTIARDSEVAAADVVISNAIIAEIAGSNYLQNVSEDTSPTLGGNMATSNHWISGDGDAEGLFVTTYGKIGVGINTPSAFLHIAPQSGSASLRLTSKNTTNGVSDIQLHSDRSIDGQESGHLEFWNDGIGQICSIEAERGSSDTKGDLIFKTQNDERVRIDEDGNVGIGTNAPAEPLHILSDAGHDAIRISENAGGEYWNAGVDAAGTLTLNDGSGDHLTLTEAGLLTVNSIAGAGDGVTGLNFANMTNIYHNMTFTIPDPTNSYIFPLAHPFDGTGNWTIDRVRVRVDQGVVTGLLHVVVGDWNSISIVSLDVETNIAVNVTGVSDSSLGGFTTISNDQKIGAFFTALSAFAKTNEVVVEVRIKK